MLFSNSDKRLKILILTIKLISIFKIIFKMVWVETPTNPTLKLIDIVGVCALAKQHNPNIVVVVDNTFASSYFQVNINTVRPR